MNDDKTIQNGKSLKNLYETFRAVGMFKDDYTYEQFKQNATNGYKAGGYLENLYSSFHQKYGNEYTREVLGKSPTDMVSIYRITPDDMTDEERFDFFKNLAPNKFNPFYATPVSFKPIEQTAAVSTTTGISEKTSEAVSKDSVMVQRPTELPQDDIFTTPVSDENPPNFLSKLLGVFKNAGELIVEIAKQPTIITQLKIAKAFKDIAVTAVDEDVFQTHKANTQYLRDSYLVNIRNAYEKTDPETKQALMDIAKEHLIFYFDEKEIEDIIKNGKVPPVNLKTKIIKPIDNTITLGLIEASGTQAPWYESHMRYQQAKEKVKKSGIDLNKYINSLYLFGEHAYEHSDSRLEFFARTAWDVALFSFAVSKGATKTPGLNLKATSNLQKAKKMGTVLEATESKALLEKMGYTSLAQKGARVILNKEGEITALYSPKLRDIALSRIAKGHEFAMKSMPYYLPKTYSQVTNEMARMEAMGEEYDPSHFAASVLHNLVNNYFDAYGEYFGTLIDPYTKTFLSKYITKRAARSFATHFISSPIGELIEEKFTSVFMDYIPRLLAGEQVETINAFLNRSLLEFITFLPLGFSGMAREVMAYSLNQKLKSLIEKKTKEAEDAKKKKEGIDKLVEASLVVNEIVDRLQKIFEEGVGLTEEEQQLLNTYIDQAIEKLASDIEGDVLSGNIPIPKPVEVVRHAEKEDIADVDSALKVSQTLVNESSKKGKKISEQEAKELHKKIETILTPLEYIVDAVEAELQILSGQEMIQEITDIMEEKKIKSNSAEGKLLKGFIELLNQRNHKIASVLTDFALVREHKEYDNLILNAIRKEFGDKVTGHIENLKDLNLKRKILNTFLISSLSEFKTEEGKKLKQLSNKARIKILDEVITPELSRQYVTTELTPQIERLGQRVKNVTGKFKTLVGDEKVLKILEEIEKFIDNKEHIKPETLYELKKYWEKDTESPVLQTLNSYINNIIARSNEYNEEHRTVNTIIKKLEEADKELTDLIAKLIYTRNLPKNSLKKQYVNIIAGKIFDKLDKDITKFEKLGVNRLLSVINDILNPIKAQAKEAVKKKLKQVEFTKFVDSYDDYDPSKDPESGSIFPTPFRTEFDVEPEGTSVLLPDFQVNLTVEVNEFIADDFERLISKKLGFKKYTRQDNKFTFHLQTMEQAVLIQDNMKDYGKVKSITRNSAVYEKRKASITEVIKQLNEQIEEYKKKIQNGKYANDEELKLLKSKIEGNERAVKENQDILNILTLEYSRLAMTKSQEERAKMKAEREKLRKESLNTILKRLQGIINKLNELQKEIPEGNSLSVLLRKTLQKLIAYEHVKLDKKNEKALAKFKERVIDALYIGIARYNYIVEKYEKMPKLPKEKRDVKSVQQASKQIETRKTDIDDDLESEILVEQFISKHGLIEEKKLKDDEIEKNDRVNRSLFASLSLKNQKAIINKLRVLRKESVRYVTDISVFEEIYNKAKEKAAKKKKGKSGESEGKSTGKKTFTKEELSKMTVAEYLRAMGKLPSEEDTGKRKTGKKKTQEGDILEEYRTTAGEGEFEVDNETLNQLFSDTIETEGEGGTGGGSEYDNMTVEEYLRTIRGKQGKTNPPPSSPGQGNKINLTPDDFGQISDTEDDPVNEFSKIFPEPREVTGSSYKPGGALIKGVYGKTKVKIKEYFGKIYDDLNPLEKVIADILMKVAPDAPIISFQDAIDIVKNSTEDKILIEQVKRYFENKRHTTYGLYHVNQRVGVGGDLIFEALRKAGFNTDYGVIFYNDTHFYSTFSHSTVMVHEGLHFMTVEALRRIPELAEEVKSFMVDIADRMQMKLEGDLEALEIFHRIFDILKEENPDSSALKVSIEEFVVMGITHKSFISALNAIEYKPKVSGLNKFLDMIKNGLKKLVNYFYKDLQFNENSALAYLSNLVERIIAERFSEPGSSLTLMPSEFPKFPPTMILENLDRFITYQNYRKLKQWLLTNPSIADIEKTINLAFERGDIPLLSAFEKIFREIKKHKFDIVHVLDLPVEQQAVILSSAIPSSTEKKEPKESVPVKPDEVAIETEKTQPVSDFFGMFMDEKTTEDLLIIDENLDVLAESQMFIKDLGTILAVIFDDMKFIDLHTLVKKSDLSLKDFMELFSPGSEKGKKVDDILKRIWKAKYSRQTNNYEKWKEVSLRRIYNLIKSRNYKPHININLTITEKKTVVEVDYTESKAIRNIEGKNVSTLVNDIELENYLEVLSVLIGKADIVYVNEIRDTTKRKSIEYMEKEMYDLLVKELYDKGYIFLGNYADKSEMPVIKFNKQLINTPLINLIYNAYSKAGQVDNSSVKFEYKVAQVMLLLIHEMKLGSNMVEILKGKVNEETSNIIANTIKDGQYKPGSVYKILKRVPFILGRKKGTEEGLLERFGISDNVKESKINGIFWKIENKKKKAYFNHITIITEQLDGSEIVEIDGVEYNLKELLFNSFNLERTDGLSLVIKTPGNNFLDFYNAYFGELKIGSLKNFIFNKVFRNPVYLKHSIQYLHPNDILARWMIKHNIAMLSFQSAKKIGKANVKLNQFASDEAIIPEEIAFEDISHDMVKGAIQPRVKSLRQVITSSYLASENQMYKSKKFFNTVKQIIKNNTKFREKLLKSALVQKRFFEKLKEIANAPNGIAEYAIANAFKKLKDMSYSEFVKNYNYIVNHPVFSTVADNIVLQEIEAIFGMELKQGSALTLVADLGVLSSERLNRIKKQIKQLGLKEEDVLDENGFLKEGYAVVSNSYAKAKNLKLGDEVIHSLIPTDGLFGINASKVVAILNEDIMPPAGIILNSDYLQGVIGRDFDIDVLYVFNYDSEIMSQSVWQNMVEGIKELQEEIRKSYIKVVNEVLNRDINVKKELAERLNIPYDKFKIETIQQALNKEVQLAFMQVLYGKSENIGINPFAKANMIMLNALFEKKIGKEVQNRTYYTTFLQLGLKFELDGITFDPHNSEQAINDVKHMIATNDTVDLPNRENFFFYSYDETLDILSDFLGITQAKEFIAKDPARAVTLVQNLKIVFDLLFGNYISVTRQQETSYNYERNANNYMRKIYKQSQINFLLSVGDYERLKQFLKKELRIKYSYMQGMVEKMGRTMEQRLPALDAFINNFVDGLKVNGNVDISKAPLLNAVGTFDYESIKSKSISRAKYIQIENRIRNLIIENFAGKKYVEQLQGSQNIENGIYNMLRLRDRENYENGKYPWIKSNEAVLFNMAPETKFSLSKIFYGIRAIVALQTDLTSHGTSSFAKGREGVYYLFFRELFRHTKIYTKVTDGKPIDLTNDVSVKVENSQLYFGYKNQWYSVDQIRGIEKVQSPKELEELRTLLFDEKKNIWVNANARAKMGEYLTFLASMDTPANITTQDRQAILKEFLNRTLNFVYQGKPVFDSADKFLILSTMIGYANASLNQQLNEMFSLSGNRPGNIENVERYSEVIGKSTPIFEVVDYSHNGITLSVIDSILPEFTRIYFETFSRTMEAERNDDISSEANEFAMVSKAEAYGNKQDKKREFLNYYYEKYKNDKPSVGFFRYMQGFFNMMTSSDKEAFEYLKNFVKDVSFIASIAMENPHGVDLILKDIHTLSQEEFLEKYENLELNYDPEVALKNHLDKFGIKYKEENGKVILDDSKVKRQLTAIYTTLAGVMNSYFLSKENIIIKVKKSYDKLITNIEMYAIRHGIKAYWDLNKEDEVDRLPMFNMSMDEYEAEVYQLKHVLAHVYEYINPYAEAGASLVDEAFYRMFKLDQQLRKLDYTLQLRLDSVARIVRQKSAELNNNENYKVSDVESHINRIAYDLSEKFFKSRKIKVEKINGEFYFKYEGKYYTIHATGLFKSIIDLFFPKLQLPKGASEAEVQAYVDNEITRAAFEAACHIRILLDYEVKTIINTMNEYMKDVEAFALANGFTDILNKVKKIRKGYLEFYRSMGKREGSYMPRFWYTANYKEAYKLYNYERILKEVTEENPEFTAEELEAEVEKRINKELYFLTEDGFGISFNPNAQHRYLPDYYTGYEKDIFMSINTYMNNMKEMLNKDIARVEYYIYLGKARIYGEHPRVIDYMSEYYAHKAGFGDIRYRAVDWDEASNMNLKGKEVEFQIIARDIFGEEKEQTYVGIISGQTENSIKFIDKEGKEVEFKVDDIFIRNFEGEVVHRHFKIYCPGNVIESLEHLADEWNLKDKHLRAKFYSAMAKGLRKFFGFTNRMLTLSIMGTFAQPPAYVMQVLGGTLNNVYRNPISNIRYIRRLGKFQQENPELFEEMMILNGLKSSEFLLDLAVYGDVALAKIGINKSFLTTVKELFDVIKENMNLANRDLKQIKVELRELLNQYAKTKDKELRKRIFQKTLEYSNYLFAKNIITEAEYTAQIRSLEATLEKGTISKVTFDAIKSVTTKQAFSNLYRLLSNRFDSSILGLKIFLKPETMLRMHSFIIGYERANKILRGTDQRFAFELAMTFVEKKQKFYGTTHKQGLALTPIGAVLQKFSHYFYDEVIRERKNFSAALKTLVFGGFSLKEHMLDRNKKPIGENSARQYVVALMVTDFLIQLSTLFMGVDNFLSPIKELQIKLIKYLVKLLNKSFREQNKFDREERELIYLTLGSLGFGWGTTAIPSIVMWDADESVNKGRFPLIPRSVSMVIDIYDALESLSEPWGTERTKTRKRSETLYDIQKLSRRLTGIDFFGNTQEVPYYFLGRLQDIKDRPLRYIPIAGGMLEAIEGK